MKKSLTIFAFLSLFAAQAFATYIVVLKDGTRMRAKAKWTVVNGKAIIKLENGQTVQLNLAEIDEAKSEEVTRMGLGDAKVLGRESQAPAPQPRQGESLGDRVRSMKPRAFGDQAKAPETTSTAPAAPVDQLDTRVRQNFERAFDNVGIFEVKMTGTNNIVRADLTTDSEDKVFNAISAAAFLVTRNAGVEGVTIERVDLFMKTTTGGAAGRFQMSRADAEAISNKTITREEYYVRKVIY